MKSKSIHFKLFRTWKGNYSNLFWIKWCTFKHHLPIILGFINTLINDAQLFLNFNHEYILWVFIISFLFRVIRFFYSYILLLFIYTKTFLEFLHPVDFCLNHRFLQILSFGSSFCRKYIFWKDLWNPEKKLLRTYEYCRIWIQLYILLCVDELIWKSSSLFICCRVIIVS